MSFIKIGEKLNSSIPRSLAAMQSAEDSALEKIIDRQAAAGADYLDINTALCEDEAATMCRVVELALARTECGIMLDSPNPAVLEQVAALCTGRPLLLNSLTLTDRFAELTALAVKTGAGVIALPIASGIPETAQERLANAEKLICRLREAGLRDEQIYIDILVQAVGYGSDLAASLQMTYALRQKYPQVHIVGGLSNVSFGLPERINLNTAAIAAAVGAGLDAAIYDVTSKPMTTALYAALAVAGQDEFGMDYLHYIRGEEEEE